MWPHRVWPLDPLARAPRRVVVAALVVGVLGSALWRPTVLSIGYLVAGVMIFAVVFGTSERRPTRVEWLGIGLTLALLAVPAVLAAQWLGVLCLVAAWLVGWCTLVGGHTWTAVAVAPFLPWLLPSRVSAWAGRATPELVPRGSSAPKPGRVAGCWPSPCASGGVRRSVRRGRPRLRSRRRQRGAVLRRRRRGLARLVFGMVWPSACWWLPRPVRAAARRHGSRAAAAGSAVGVGDTAWRAGRAVRRPSSSCRRPCCSGVTTTCLETEGLTYAEYARQGFWQLLWVSALTLLVISVRRPRGRARDHPPTGDCSASWSAHCASRRWWW